MTACQPFPRPPARPALRGLLAGLLAWAALGVQAQAPGTTNPAAEPASAMRAQRLPAGVRLPLDGTLSHPAWQLAPVHGHFAEKLPDTGAVPGHATRVRVLFDDQAIHVGIDALDPQPDLIRAPLVRHDGVNRTQDFVVVYLDAIGLRQSAQFFRVNAAGSTADGMHTAADDSEDFAPDFDFDAATARHAGGWTAVLRIPFASLRFAPAPADASSGADGAQPWRIMVGRRVPRAQFYMHTSVLVPRDAPSFIATLQPLEGVRLPERHQFLTLRPSLTWRTERLHDAGGPVRSASAFDASLDLKWRPLHEMVVDATLNPDFSQVALDVPQLAGNTRYALSFPETRPFFFESSDLLRTPTEALYTRSFTRPRWGLRGSWRGAQLAGTALAVDDRGGGAVLVPGVYGTGLAEQPASRAALARLHLQTDGLQWGGLAALRRYDDGGHNRVAGPDLAWQIDGAWRARLQWLQSDTSAQAVGQRLQAGSTTRGHLAHAKLVYQGDRREADLALEDVSAGFRDDTGFIPQAGVQRATGRVGLGWGNVGPFNEFWLNLKGERVQDRANGDVVLQGLSPGLWVTGAHNLEAWLYLHGLAAGTAALRPAAGAALLQQRYLEAGLVATPAAWLPLLEAELTWGQVADVGSNPRLRPGGQASLSLPTRLLPRLELEPRLVYGWLRGGGRTVQAESAHQLLARWHFSPQQTLRAIVQHTALVQRGQAVQQATTGSLTWAWRQSAGTVLYVGAARSRDGVQAASRGNEAFIKLQVDADELRRSW